MKPYLLFVLIFWSVVGRAQTNADPSTGCTDVVYLKNGSIYRGKILEHAEGGTLVVQTWSGLILHVQEKKVRRVVQRCPGDDESAKKRAAIPRPYDFREHGWYNVSSFSVLAGRTWWDENTIGVSLQNVTGYALNRWIGLGLGLGVEAYSPYVQEFNQVTYPVFVEARGYFQRKNSAPFYAFGGGWGFAGGSTSERWGYNDNWTGGWLLQGKLGYRLGNHFSLYGGLRFQRQNRVWTDTWGASEGTDKILHRRLELGMAVQL
ncbi:MAG: hypothetical protein JNL02_12395 [Saprospiraceae bacterium]|nr:hypothetical protein [Saprospiraceae bacterium]